MKKLICLALFLAMIAFMTAPAIAQPGAQPFISVSNNTVTDTVVNAGVKSQKLPVSGWQETLSIVSTVTKISGTLGGTIRCYGSLDNVNWVQVDTSSYTVTDVSTQSYEWKTSPSRFPYYMVTYTGVTGPMSAKLNTKGLARKR